MVPVIAEYIWKLEEIRNKEPSEEQITTTTEDVKCLYARPCRRSSWYWDSGYSNPSYITLDSCYHQRSRKNIVSFFYIYIILCWGKIRVLFLIILKNKSFYIKPFSKNRNEIFFYLSGLVFIKIFLDLANGFLSNVFMENRQNSVRSRKLTILWFSGQIILEIVSISKIMIVYNLLP